MTKPKRRVIAGLLSGTLGLSATAQEPAAPTEPAKPAEPVKEAPAKPAEPETPKEDPFKAPDNVAAAPADAVKSETGLASIVLTKGTGTEKPTASDTVKVHYTGWKASDGEMFDSSAKRGQPAEFALNGVIKGWTEGVQLMVVGEKRRFWIPAELAYGEEGRVAGDLTFDVELLEIVKAPEAPKNLVAPADALATESGLKSKILKAGEGDTMPGPDDMVTTHFTGWNATGEFLGTTTRQPKPTQIPLNGPRVPKAWAEALQLMKKGEKRRFWIPAGLVEGGGDQAEDTIVDFELIDFKPIPKPPPPPKDPNAPADVAAAPADAQKTESGIAYTVIKAGAGEGFPKDGDRVKVNFSGWDANSSSIGSNKRGGQGEPMAIVLEEAPIIAWTEILKTMKTGESRRIWVPENLTFRQKRPGVPEGQLTFDLELVEFSTPPPAPEAPADVAAPPADAQKTESGISYKVLKKGTGTAKPNAIDRVKVHYAGWTTDGKLFDNSIQREEKAEFGLNQVIAGWTEGLQLMVEGEKTRFWIPEELAYKGQPGRPAGMLVFDVELFEIIKPTLKKKIEAVTPPIQVNPPKPKEEKKEEATDAPE